MKPTVRDRLPRVSWAAVNGGTGGVFGGSGDLIILRTGVGIYTVQLAKPVSAATYGAFVSISSGGAGGPHAAAINTVTGSGFVIWTFVANTGGSVDINFSVQVLVNP